MTADIHIQLRQGQRETVNTQQINDGSDHKEQKKINDLL